MPPDLGRFLEDQSVAGAVIVLVDNNPIPEPALRDLPSTALLDNRNFGGIAGAFNCGVEEAIRLGACWVTLLDQDSRLEPYALDQLREPWDQAGQASILIGPNIWDYDRQARHGRTGDLYGVLRRTRLLISSGTTFQTSDWPLLDRFDEALFIDFVDHIWCFKAQARGFTLWHHEQVRLLQCFGEPHPHCICRWCGMQLYSPERHYYGLRNLKAVLRHRDVPIDLKLKELLKMLFKPWAWLLFEPNRPANFKAILAALRDPVLL